MWDELVDVVERLLPPYFKGLPILSLVAGKMVDALVAQVVEHATRAARAARRLRGSRNSPIDLDARFNAEVAETLGGALLEIGHLLLQTRDLGHQRCVELLKFGRSFIEARAGFIGEASVHSVQLLLGYGRHGWGKWLASLQGDRIR